MASMATASKRLWRGCGLFPRLRWKPTATRRILTKDYSHESFAIKLNQLTTEIREAAKVDPVPIFPMGASWKPIYKRNNFNERRMGARKALMFTDFAPTDGALVLKESLALTRFQEVTGKTTRPPGHLHDRTYHRVTTYEFGMLWETMELTAAELAPVKPEKPAVRQRAGHGARSRHQRQTKSLMGVA